MHDSATANFEEKPLSLAHFYSIDEAIRVSEMFARSGYFKDARTASQVFAKIIAGQELGVGPMTSMSMIHIVDGKATMDATLVGAQIKKSGRYDYRVKQSDEHACSLEFFERGKLVGESIFSMEDAQRAGLVTRMVWKSYPKDMLRSRAMTRGARMYCPDVFNGAIYTPEEIGAQIALDANGAMVVVDEPTRADAHSVAEISIKESFVSSVDAQLVREVYRSLGFDVKSRDGDVHRAAMHAVSSQVHLEPPVTRWSEFTVTQLEAFLSQRTQGGLKAA